MARLASRIDRNRDRNVETTNEKCFNNLAIGSSHGRSGKAGVKQMIPKDITRRDVDEAIARISRSGTPSRRQSRGYCLVWQGQHFPPKLVISEACRRHFPDGLPPSEFTGGAPTNDLLRDLGYEVVACSCGGTRGRRVG